MRRAKQLIDEVLNHPHRTELLKLMREQAEDKESTMFYKT